MSRSVLNFAEGDGTTSYSLFTALGDTDIAPPLEKIDPEAATALAFSRSPASGLTRPARHPYEWPGRSRGRRARRGA